MGVIVPTEVFAGLERVRREGRTNTLDREAVQYHANENGDHATVVWLEDHKDLYAKGIFAGFEPVGTRRARRTERAGGHASRRRGGRG